MEASGVHSSISDEYTELYRPLSFGLRFSYGFGHVLNDICASMWFTYLLIFFHCVLEFDSAQAGLILCVGQVADALATPFVGYHSDKTDDFWLCKYGRRKTWHLLGTFCVLGAFPFIFAPCVGCEGSHKWAQLIYFSSFVIIFQFGWAAVQISHLSLIPELTPNEHDRTKLMAIRFSFTVFSNVLVYGITWTVLHVTSDNAEDQIGPDDIKKFSHIVWAGLGVGLCATVLFHCLVPEYRLGAPTGRYVRATALRRSIASVLCDANLYRIAGVYMATRLFVNLSQVFIPLYLHKTLNMAAQALAVIPLTAYMSSFITSFAIEPINRLCGRKVAFIIGVILGLIACIWTQLRSDSSFIKYEIYGIAILFGAAGSIMLVTSLGLTADLIGANTDRGALIYGIMSFCDKLSNGVAIIIIQDMHHPYSSSLYYRNVLSYVCGGAAVFGLLSLALLRTKIRRHAGQYARLLDDDQPAINSASVTT